MTRTSVHFGGIAAGEASNHARVTANLTVARAPGRPALVQPSKKFYPGEQSPIAGVDYRVAPVEDLYPVLGDFIRDGARGVALALLPEHGARLRWLTRQIVGDARPKQFCPRGVGTVLARSTRSGGDGMMPARRALPSVRGTARPLSRGGGTR